METIHKNIIEEAKEETNILKCEDCGNTDLFIAPATDYNINILVDNKGEYVATMKVSEGKELDIETDASEMMCFICREYSVAWINEAGEAQCP